MTNEVSLLSKERYMTIDPSSGGTTALCCVDENGQISFFSSKNKEWREQLAFIKDKVASFQPTVIVYEDCDFVIIKGGKNMTGLFKLFGGMEALSLYFDFIQVIGSVSVIRVKAIHKALYKKVRQIEGLTYEIGREEVEELEAIDRLRRFQGGSEFLRAYLLYKSIARSNYQIELLKHADYKDDEKGKSGQEKLLKAIARDIELFEKDQEKRDKIPVPQPTNEQLLIMLGERIASGEIKRELGNFGNYLMVESEQGILKVDLHDGKITPDPVEGFLKKHGFVIDEEEVAKASSGKAEKKKNEV
ncbi:17521_t:CDS:2 [Funneliformis geosporum]|nr:17521_t:CDS:2 [Funneliformis geosporum]